MLRVGPEGSGGGGGGITDIVGGPGITVTGGSGPTATVSLAGGNPTGLPPATQGLTLSLHANLGADPPTGNVLDWSDWARPGLYWTSGGTGAVFDPAGINGLPTLDFTAGVTSSYTQARFSAFTDSDAYVFPTGWTIGAIVEYTGAVNYTNWLASPQIIGSGNQGAGLLCGLDPANPLNVIFAAFVFDASASPQTVVAVSVSKATAHYVIVTFDPTGTFTIWVDGAAPVTSGPWTFQTVGSLQASNWTIGQNVIEASSHFNGSILRIDNWCRALAPATEIPALQAFYVTEGGF